MRKCTDVALLCLALFAMSCNGPVVQKPYNEGINITPRPLELVENEGRFTLSGNTVFVSNDASVDKVASFFADKLKKSTGYGLRTRSAKADKDYIKLELDADLLVNGEGYLLDVTPDGIHIRAKTARGVFYGLQTLMQLLPAEAESSRKVNGMAWTVPAVSIRDEPRFPHRGILLDPCRHFVDVEFVKKHLDVMAMLKLNRLQWHLTDDQGWRIEIKKHPGLTAIGAMRTEGEGHAYGPFFYTQEQIKEVVAYAKERFIEVIPEVEVPGHAVAALAAHPELSCTGDPIEVRNVWGISNDIFCAGNEDTFAFLEDVWTEIIPLFESDYVHIGGDEAPKGRWKACPKCQRKIRELGLKSDGKHSAEDRLQGYFVKRVGDFLAAKGKKMIGWEEILTEGDADFAPGTAITCWRGEESAIAAANRGYDVVMGQSPLMYLDIYQGDAKINPVTIYGNSPSTMSTLEKTYAYEPLPSAIAEDKRHHILGPQANMWNEYNYTPWHIEQDLYPRAIALAELAWTSPDRKDYTDFERRIDNQRVRLDLREVDYYIPLPQQKNAPSCNFVAFTDSVTLDLHTTEPLKMVYSTGGGDPTSSSAVYASPIVFRNSTVFKVRSVLASGKMGDVRTITLEKQAYAPPVAKEAGSKPGLKVAYYRGHATKASDLDGRTPDETDRIAAPEDAKHWVKGYRELSDDDYWSAVLTGYLAIPEDGVYYFSTEAEELWLDGNLFISNAGEVKRYSRADRSAALAKGPHPIKVVRLPNIIGGWPPLWNPVRVSIRKDTDQEFKVMDASFF